MNPNGSRNWRLADRFGGKPKQLSFGPYPAASLADAREKLKEAKQLLASGRDPSHLRKLDKVTAALNASSTFGLLVDEYLERQAPQGAAATTMAKNRQALAVPEEVRSGVPGGALEQERLDDHDLLRSISRLASAKAL